MNGLRRGYRRPESGRYRELFLNKYIDAQPRRDWLGGLHWQQRTSAPPEKHEQHPMIIGLILLLIVIACFASALICAIPFRLIFH